MSTSKRLNSDRLETQFKDFKPALDRAEATEEAQRCINCFDAPCIKACPTGIDIPKFIRRIGSNHVQGAAKTILDSNIFGLSCAECCPVETLCEGACVYNDLNHKPITIGKLQRFAIETAYDASMEFYKPGKASGKKVALLGAGPASFAAAHELRIHGHEAVIFEKSEIAGGLNTTGIAPYKMRAEVSLREVERILKMGVKVEYGKELGRNVDLNKLVQEYDAVFLGLGLGADSKFDAAGADHPRVTGAVDFIAKMKTCQASELAWMKNVKTALVIGGGNTALDACRELKGLGVEQVVVSYRRGEAEMSGYKHEFKWARQEGVDFWFHTLGGCRWPGNAYRDHTDVERRPGFSGDRPGKAGVVADKNDWFEIRKGPPAGRTQDGPHGARENICRWRLGQWRNGSRQRSG
ncbi:MAG: FAD-dependent oxidoreductase [Deltaproteobacteria bacterium]|nr:FAD-dependent oxidoreductase [Deltaproteobacteria bacterium]